MPKFQRDKTQWMIQPNINERGKPFPLSDMQQAYWIGRDATVGGGGTAMQGYLEFLCPSLDLAKLENALERLLQRHEMLRAVVTEDGRQQVQPMPLKWPVQVEDLTALSKQEQETRLEQISHEMGETVSNLERWPQSEIRFSKLNDSGKGHLHMRFDQWAIDGRSFQIVMLELFQLYANLDASLPEPEITFQDYILALEKYRTSPKYAESLKYWDAVLPNLAPAPRLPAAEFEELSSDQTVKRSIDKLTKEETATLQKNSGLNGLSLPSLVAAVYGETLALWSSSERFTLNIPRFNRDLTWHPGINDVVGEFASFSLIEFDNQFEDIVTKAQEWQNGVWKGMEHGDVSGMHLLRELSRKRGSADFEAMPVVFTMMPTRKAGDNEWEKALASFGKMVRVHGSTPQVKQDCIVSLYDDELLVYWDSRLSAFPEGMPEDMFSAFMTALRTLAVDQTAWTRKGLVQIPNSQKEVRTSLHIEEEIPPLTVLDLFNARAESNGNAPALIPAGARESISYKQLIRAVSNLSKAIPRPVMAEGNSTPGSVALLMRKSWKAVAAALASMASGRPYMPLDPENPKNRLQLMLSVGQADIIIADKEFIPLINDTPCKIVVIDDQNLDEVPKGASMALNSSQNLGGPAYVMLTSGTTGPPKAVWVGHRGLLNAILHSNKKFGISGNDRFYAITALHHDLSVYDMFGALGAGAAVVIPDSAGAHDAQDWLDDVQKYQVTIWNSVPIFQRLLMEEAHRKGLNLPIRLHLLGGDWLPLDTKTLSEAVCPGSNVYSTGGPTETTLWNINYHLEALPEGWKTVPYGRPLPNNRYHLLNEKLQEVPDWVAGEMYCSGVGVCLNTSANAESIFKTHPNTGERLYRTGDIGRYRPDGLIEILGRKDFQINISGYRFNPLEVESALAERDDVKRAALVPVTSRDKTTILGSYIVSPHVETPPDPDSLRAYLLERFPFQMVPKVWCVSPQIPLTKNGKFDRTTAKTLVERSITHTTDVKTTESSHVPPVTELEEFIIQLWNEILDVDIVSMNANFFKIGGDSLKAMRILTRISSRLHVRPGLSEFFAKPTPAGLVTAILKSLSVIMQQKKQHKYLYSVNGRA